MNASVAVVVRRSVLKFFILIRRPKNPWLLNRKAARKIAALEKRGRSVDPVILEGRKIALTFWGQAWCDNLESYSDYENRLPRGRTYVRNGSVIDLQIERGRVRALVSGSEIYEVEIAIKRAAKARWRALAPRAVGCLEKDLEELLSFLDCPQAQRKKVRTTNAIERAFREVRRRTRPMSCFQNSPSVDRIIYGVLSHLNKTWQEKPLREFTHNT